MNPNIIIILAASIYTLVKAHVGSIRNYDGKRLWIEC